VTKKLKRLTKEESKTFKEAYALGRDSCEEGVPLSHNPYKPKTVAHNGWALGWKVGLITKAV
jgi:hypothetical protein